MNLQTEYLGLKLNSPFVVGASPFCDNTAVARRLQDSGAAAVVMRSLFEEQFAPPPVPAPLVFENSTAATENFPEHAEYQLSPDQYLRQLENLKAHLTIPVIASLNAHRPGGWIEFARRLESAGADAIELNFYQVVADPSIDSDQVETDMLETVGLTAGAVKIPIAVKLSPYHTAVAQLAVALELAGAAGIVLFNRFYQPDVNPDELEVQPQLRLSDPQELLLRLRWLAILSPQLRGSLAATGGIHTSNGAAKAILTGAHVVQLVSVLLKHGPHVIPTLRDGLLNWMRGHGFESLDQCRGLLNSRRCRDASAFERANYLRTLQSWKV
ncbi:dihydroorotate dehydrogenase-like protein [Horticoccus sp. 23ND18S-11]|uniref:dihydroorotate dehydrogenase-like protein n=1 Tax=Horticoccus sp. 23ND18S-11 TaxID=3391832 RepID=UPI0039C8C6CE